MQWLFKRYLVLQPQDLRIEKYTRMKDSTLVEERINYRVYGHHIRLRYDDDA